ncbi:MAG: hypothetical protein ACJ0G4_05915 [Alphaproteobacteria bacterium]
MKFLFFILFIIGCSNQNNPYFPLEKVKSWSYQVEIQPEIEKKTTYKKINIALGKRKLEIDGNKTFFYPFLREDGSIYLYNIDKSGIYRNGSAFSKDKRISSEKAKRLVLPIPLEIGRKWAVESKTFLILKRYPYYDYRATTNFDIEYEIVSKTEVVNTPMGKFKDCLLVKGVGKTKFIGDSEIGSIEINITSDEWYAKGIGLVKTIRTEKTDSDLFGTTKMTQLLENYQFN